MEFFIPTLRRFQARPGRCSSSFFSFFFFSFFFLPFILFYFFYLFYLLPRSFAPLATARQELDRCPCTSNCGLFSHLQTGRETSHQRTSNFRYAYFIYLFYHFSIFIRCWDPTPDQVWPIYMMVGTVFDKMVQLWCRVTHWSCTLTQNTTPRLV